MPAGAGPALVEACRSPRSASSGNRRERERQQPDHGKSGAAGGMAQKLGNQQRTSHRTSAPGKIQQGERSSHALWITPAGEHVGRRHRQAKAESVDAKGGQGLLVAAEKYRSLLRQSARSRRPVPSRDCAGPTGLPDADVANCTSSSRPASLSRRCHCAESRGRMLPSSTVPTPVRANPRWSRGSSKRRRRPLAAL